MRFLYYNCRPCFSCPILYSFLILFVHQVTAPFNLLFLYSFSLLVQFHFYSNIIHMVLIFTMLFGCSFEYIYIYFKIQPSLNGISHSLCYKTKWRSLFIPFLIDDLRVVAYFKVLQFFEKLQIVDWTLSSYRLTEFKKKLTCPIYFFYLWQNKPFIL